MTTDHHPRNATADRAVSNWLFIVCALVFAMVVLGGVTRLTGSGLSMAEWRLIMGVIPPLDDAEWQRVFEIYKQTPEFVKVNSHMDVHDFKKIFWLEYLHRLLGRILGIAFSLPLLYFAVRRYIPIRELPWYLLLLALGGAQGLIGKVMVASGQVDAPHVSPYRLAAHLAAAVLVFSMAFWRALSLRNPARGPRHPWFTRTAGLTSLIALTLLSGAFVAGLRAGKIYNTFPKMGDGWLPPGLDALEPGWRNLFENATTAQFNHRLLAVTTFVAVVAYWLSAHRSRLPARAVAAANVLVAGVTVQVALGISTLVMAVPVALGVSHQAVAMLVFATVLLLLHRLRTGGPA